MRETAKRLSAVILAGGKSSRFGRDKSGLELGGERVVERLAWTLAEFPFERFALVAAPGKTGGWPGGLAALADDQEGLGPIGGIATALRHLPGGILVTACDMPFISGELIEWLLGRDDAEAAAVVPRHAGGIEPLFAIYNKSLLPALEAAIGAGRYAIRSVLQGPAVRFAALPERFDAAREFANVNTPEDHARILEMRERSK
ncbi:MAG TPA: molybdenum cofactor guanylyltransferase [Candidatus Binatia bacterium]